jgi:hypothetical protein
MPRPFAGMVLMVLFVGYGTWLYAVFNEFKLYDRFELLLFLVTDQGDLVCTMERVGVRPVAA